MQFFHTPLFLAVQQSNIFADSKAFADAIPKVSWEQACALYEQQLPSGNALSDFVDAHFTFAAKPELELLGKIDTVDEYISTLWEKLARPPTKESQGSLLALPHTYTVPGGRFNEIYYWDTYFTALGLMDQGNVVQVASMLENFINLINKYGHVPNGNRSYYISRSQPPVCSLMVDLLWPHYHVDCRWVARVTKALEREYTFWMSQEAEPFGGRVVTMPCGGLLNRYWDNDPSPRPESYKEDIAEAQHIDSQHKKAFYRHIRAACESGWDFSSRWLADPQKLESIRTCDIVPVDLNALMFQLEKCLATCYKHHNNMPKANHYQERASKRKTLINTYLWDPDSGIYFDWVLSEQQRSTVQSLATTVPLFCEMCSEQQSYDIGGALANTFLKEGGLVTTAISSKQQWDSPNGWAPLQWFAVAGLLKHGQQELAFDIVERWLAMIEASYAQTACLLEKYNVLNWQQIAGGGEYVVQQGFGWTNGVTSRFYELQKARQVGDEHKLQKLFASNLPTLVIA
ncbi:trehalase family glycosidase [Pseudoalteromonas sp. SSDWG2]|uniref:trehalase family glycosidase n=1 Tax=Pseudoalteromonas sp. SSDWG2 TaxID=3139391 RepID=UPI003BACEFA5